MKGCRNGEKQGGAAALLRVCLTLGRSFFARKRVQPSMWKALGPPQKEGNPPSSPDLQDGQMVAQFLCSIFDFLRFQMWLDTKALHKLECDGSSKMKYV